MLSFENTEFSYVYVCYTSRIQTPTHTRILVIFYFRIVKRQETTLENI